MYLKIVLALPKLLWCSRRVVRRVSHLLLKKLEKQQGPPRQLPWRLHCRVNYSSCGVALGPTIVEYQSVSSMIIEVGLMLVNEREGYIS